MKSKQLVIFVCMAIYSVMLFAYKGNIIQTLSYNTFISKPKKEKKQPTDNNMDTYTNLWQKVEELENQGLPQSADSLVLQIYNKSVAENNPSQQIKATLYTNKYKIQREEEGNYKAIVNIEEEVKKLNFPEKNILQNYLATFYWQYYQQNQYTINQRTNTVSFSNPDFRMWSANDFVQKVMQLYDASIESAADLYKIPVTQYNDLINAGNHEGRERQPTLYHLLASAVLQFYTNENTYLTQPAYQFAIREASYFDEANKFAKMKISSIDSISFKLKSLHIYQQILQHNIDSKNEKATLYTDIQRLGFIYQNYVGANKEMLYSKAILSLYDKYVNTENETYIAYHLAQNRMAQPYDKEFNIKNKNNIAEAEKILQKAISNTKTSFFRNECKTLLCSIQQGNVTIRVEHANEPQKPILANVTYTNVNKISVQFYRLSEDKNWDFIKLKFKRNRQENEIENFVENLPKETNITIPLLDEKDLRTHTTNVKFPALSKGKYVAVIQAENSKNKTSYKQYIEFYATHISIVQRAQNGDVELLLANRNTGEPLVNTSAKRYEVTHEYDNKTYYNITKISSPQNVKSDNNGFITCTTEGKQSKMYMVSVRKEDDFYMNDDYFGTYKPYNQTYNNSSSATILFTDRSIYRPTQTIYFKGVCYDVVNTKTKLKIGYKDEVRLFDANNQEIKKIEVETNEYGSYQGKFDIPDGLMTGVYSIRSHFGVQQISVEEYKRPTFEVKLDTLKGSYRLNDKVTVKGFAKTYAGSNITDAQVKYRITRKAQYPYWHCWFWWLPYPQQNQVEIANGITQTKEDGMFEIEFNALPDESIDPKTKPIFNFEVQCDVTDLNGETRSNTATINVGYIALQVGIQANSIFKKSAKDTIVIETKNVNNIFEPAKGVITIKRLQSLAMNKRSRMNDWAKPDVFAMTQDEFATYFPNDIYADEDEYQKWKTLETVLNKEFDTKKEKNIIADFVKTAKEGKYVVEINTKDAFGELINVREYVDVYDDVSAEASTLHKLLLQLDKTSIDVNEKLATTLESNKSNAWILYEQSGSKGNIQRQWLQLKGKKRKQDILPLASDLNKLFSISAFSIQQNRVHQAQFQYSVVAKPKPLKIELSTFRDKLYPGQNETWRVRIKGDGAEKVQAEMLTAMYDASLDAIKPHAWSAFSFNTSPIGQEEYYQRYNLAFQTTGFQSSYAQGLGRVNYNNECYHNSSELNFDALNVFGFYIDAYRGGRYYMYENDAMPMQAISLDEVSIRKTSAGEGKTRKRNAEAVMAAAPMAKAEKGVDSNEEINNREEETEKVTDDKPANSSMNQPVQIRKNFQETAFFMPQLVTNTQGEIEIQFTLPDALTQWKLMALAHTKDMRIAQLTRQITSSKDIMLFPNMPRFLREDDEIFLQTKIANTSTRSVAGTVKMELLDANTEKNIASLFDLKEAEQSFSIEKGKNTVATFKVKIPKGLGVVKYRITATAGGFSDGEENILPILSNEMLVTESMPMPVNAGQTKSFTFAKLKENNPDFRTHSLTLEYTANPAWYAIQALPYLMEFPYECSEQTFSRLYANSIASHIANSNPKIKAVFESWEKTPALESNLEKNQELKMVLLQQTPWVLEAQNESERKRRVGLLFNIHKMKKEFIKAESKLADMQLSNGGFPWFSGYPWDDRFITQHIVCGFGKLDKLGVKELRTNGKTASMIQKALQYIDGKMYNDYLEIQRWKSDGEYVSSFIAHYLYTRSFYNTAYPINPQFKIAYDYFYAKELKHWTSLDKYSQGMAALTLYRAGDKTTANAIIKSLKQHMYETDEMGLYFVKESGYYWYQAPIETQAMMIEAFDEVANDQPNVEKMKTWLLKQKQTQDWKTTKATLEACYALLLRGVDYLSESSLPDITIGNNTFKIEEKQTEAGTGYFKKRWDKQEITPTMATVKVTNKNKVTSWGALYWQYFAGLDKITPHETPLRLVKKLFVEKPSDRGPVITPVTEKTTLKVGDKIKVRIELRVDRNMEYIHMKDMRSAGFEPMNALTQYKYQDNLGYIESTRDASTDFFFAYLPKGEYVFEYPLRVFQSGNMSNGITNIQCMYAPEFTSHSEGVRVNVN